MSTTYYMDTSALIKLYHKEAGSSKMDELFLKEENSLVISQLATVELRSAFYRRLRMEEISTQALQTAVKSFEDDCQNRFEVKPLFSPHYERAATLLSQYGVSHAIRTLDALQFAVYLVDIKTGVFVGADERLIELAKAEGCVTLNPCV